jgi:hypothetical protein
MKRMQSDMVELKKRLTIKEEESKQRDEDMKRTQNDIV